MEKINAKVDLENYTMYTFSMYGKGDVIRLIMWFAKKLVSMVLDRFGHDVMLVKDDETHSLSLKPSL